MDMGYCSICKFQRPSKTFGFPEDTKLLMEWKKLLNIDVSTDTTKFRICPIHFTEDQYVRDLQFEMTGGRLLQKLKPDAVPNNVSSSKPKILSEITIATPAIETNEILTDEPPLIQNDPPSMVTQTNEKWKAIKNMNKKYATLKKKYCYDHNNTPKYNLKYIKFCLLSYMDDAELYQGLSECNRTLPSFHRIKNMFNRFVIRQSGDLNVVLSMRLVNRRCAIKGNRK